MSRSPRSAPRCRRGPAKRSLFRRGSLAAYGVSRPAGQIFDYPILVEARDTCEPASSFTKALPTRMGGTVPYPSAQLPLSAEPSAQTPPNCPRTVSYRQRGDILRRPHRIVAESTFWKIAPLRSEGHGASAQRFGLLIIEVFAGLALLRAASRLVAHPLKGYINGFVYLLRKP